MEKNNIPNMDKYQFLNMPQSYESDATPINFEETNTVPDISKIVSEMIASVNILSANLDLINFVSESYSSRKNYEMYFHIIQRIMNSTVSLQNGCNELIDKVLKNSL